MVIATVAMGMTAGSFGQMRPPDFGQMRASDQDRDAAADLLKTAYAEGRLGGEEYQERVGRALSARTYADLDALTADLPGRYMMAPAAPAGLTRPGQRTNALAVAALVCGVAQLFTGMITTIPAIVLGHLARQQIRRTGQGGAALAAWGLTLGWLGIAIPLLAVIAVIASLGH